MSNRDETLKNFMQEFFPFTEFRRIGLFTSEMKGDYAAQAERVRTFFGLESVYEYGSREIRCHLSFNGDRPEGYEDFVTVSPSIYE